MDFYIYLASITEIVTLFKEHFSNLILESFSSSATLLIKNAGSMEEKAEEFHLQA